jgi:hypothetical protein
MYTALAKHSGMSLNMKCKGDLWIDDHHTADEHQTPVISLEASPSLTSYLRLYKIPPSPSAWPSKTLWVKSEAFADTELDSLRLMR